MGPVLIRVHRVIRSKYSFQLYRPSDIWFDCFSSVEGFGLEAEARMTTWHIMIPSDIEPDGGYSQDISEGNRPCSVQVLRYNWLQKLLTQPTCTHAAYTQTVFKRQDEQNTDDTNLEPS